MHLRLAAANAMRIAVIIKQVPDTEARIALGADGRPDLAGVKFIINPYDEYAIEEAVTQAQTHSAATLAIMCGDDSSRTNLTQALALGIDEAILVSDSALDSADGLGIARALAAAVRSFKPDLVLTGRQGVDYDWGLAGIAVAEELGWAHVSIVSKLELSGGNFRAESEGDDGKLITEGALPVVITVDKGINEPRLPSLKGIMAAKKKSIQVNSLSDLGLTAGDVGAAGVELVGVQHPPAKQPGRIIDGASVQEKVTKLIDVLRNEAKVI
jgi:electron transfer flavoprotein beta subunit